MAALTSAQKQAILMGSHNFWRGARESGVRGNTMLVLERKGLAVVCRVEFPHRRMVYRLTAYGLREKKRLIRESA